MGKVMSVTETFKDAVKQFAHEQARDQSGMTLATRWMALAAEILDWNTLNTDRVPLNNMAYLASKYDISVVKPYYMAGINDHTLIEKYILEDIDAELAAKL